MSDLYDTDFYAWASQQAALLRAGNLSAADIANIAEEIETMGRSEKRELVSRLTDLLLLLLKWDCQPGARCTSAELAIDIARDAFGDQLADNPSLKAVMPELVARAFSRARRQAAIDTGFVLESFPERCPWTFEQAMQVEP